MKSSIAVIMLLASTLVVAQTTTPPKPQDTPVGYGNPPNAQGKCMDGTFLVDGKKGKVCVGPKQKAYLDKLAADKKAEADKADSDKSASQTPQ